MSNQGPPVPFSSLPLSKAHDSTKLNAWGAYGNKDEKGFLNRQTDEIVAAAAASEIKTGIRVSLNAALDFQGKDISPFLSTLSHSLLTRPHSYRHSPSLWPPSLSKRRLPEETTHSPRRHMALQHTILLAMGRAPSLRLPDRATLLQRYNSRRYSRHHRPSCFTTQHPRNPKP